MSDDKDPRIAPEGWLWVCHACGKWARDRYGIEGDHYPGWDESCMLNSRMHPTKLLTRNQSGRIVEIKSDEVQTVERD